jgi:MFS transporter, ACS family, hexuronate transporter
VFTMTTDPGERRSILFSMSPQRYRWLAVFLMWLAHLVYFSVYSSVGVLGPVLKHELGLTNAEFGILCGAIGVGTTAVQIPGGIWCDILGVRKLMTPAFVVAAASAFLFSCSTSLYFASIALFCLGIAVGCSQIAAAKGIVDWFPYSGRATAMGIKQTGVNAGGIAGALALPLLLGLWDWRFLFKSLSALAFLFAFCFGSFYRDAPAAGNRVLNQPFRFREGLLSLKERHFLLVTTSGVFLIMVQFSFSSYVVLYLNQSLGYSLGTSGIILASAFAVGAFARVGWGLVTDYLFKSREIALVIIGAIGAASSVALSLVTPSTPTWYLYLLSVFFGISVMGWNGIWITLVGEASRGKSTGMGIGLSFFFANIGLLIGPPLFGLITDFFHSFFVSWIFVALCMIMVSLLLFLAARTSTHEPQAP